MSLSIQELVGEYGVQSFPTFLVFKDSEKIEQFSSAEPAKIKSLIRKHCE